METIAMRSTTGWVGTVTCVVAFGSLASCGSNSTTEPGVSGAAGQSQAPDPTKLAVRIRANVAAFAHTDGISGQTAQRVRSGIRSLRLYRDKNDSSPVELFNFGPNPVEVGYSDGDNTLVAQIDPSKVPQGTYTFVRMVQTHSRFRINGTFHDAGKSMPGVFDDLWVMTDGTMVDGTLRNAGHYVFAFESSAGDKKQFTGDDALVPGYSTTSGAVGVVEAGEWAVWFPAQVVIPAQFSNGSALTIDVNMFESFRWTDLPGEGFLPGVFDATALSYELVQRFGGNEFVTTFK
jgi:hypothetical protein